MLWAIRLVGFVLVLVLATPSMSPAQQPAPQLRSYVLGPGDTIAVLIAGNDDLGRTLPIGPDGQVTLPLIGVVVAAGLTVDQLQTRLTQLYRQYLKNPQVTVIVMQFRRVKVTVIGQVGSAGPRDLPPGSTVLDAIGLAGGLLDSADPGQAYLIRNQREILPINIAEILAGRGSTNVVLQDGDVIVVPASGPIYVLGEVLKPGSYPMKSQLALLDALLLAGGLTERASIPEARIIRNRTETIPVNLEGLLIKADPQYNIPLRSGDILFVPEDAFKEYRVYVLGQVNAPGAFPYRTTRTAFQAVLSAGGVTAQASLRSAYIVRRKPQGEGQGDVIQVDLEALIRRGDRSKDIQLREGDVLYIPQSPFSSIVTFLQSILAVLSGVADLFSFFR